MLKQQHYVSEQDYLTGEMQSDIKHEYVNGEVYAMAEAHKNHVVLTGNFSRLLGNHLEGKTCKPYSSDMKVKVDSKYFYPDVVVDCSDFDGYFIGYPTIIVEVLSKSTRQHDKTFKRDFYFSISTLREYVLVEQDFVEVEVWRRIEQDHWHQTFYYLGDEIYFESIDLNINVEDLYQRVNNTDMQQWLQRKKFEQGQ